MKKEFYLATLVSLFFFSTQIVLITAANINLTIKSALISMLVLCAIGILVLAYSLRKHIRAFASQTKREHEELAKIKSQQLNLASDLKRLDSLESAKEEIVRKQTMLFDLALNPQNEVIPNTIRKRVN